MTEPTGLVSKQEALQLVNRHIDQCVDVTVLEQLYEWKGKLTTWIREERSEN